MGIESVSLIIAAFVNGSLAIAALLRNYRSRLYVRFAALSGILFAHDACLGLASFETPVLSNPRLPLLTTWLSAPATIALLGAIVPQYQARLNRLAGLSLLCVAFLIPVGFLPLYDRFGIFLHVLSDVLLLIPAALWLYTLLKAERVTPLNREKLRFRYAFWGGVITLQFFVTNALHFAGYPVPPLGTLARTLYLIFVFQIFIQKEWMTAEEVVAKMSLFGGVALILSTIYWSLVSWVGPQRDLFLFNTFIASFVVLVLFDPIRSLSTKLTRKLFLRKNSQLEAELTLLSQELLGNLDPGQLHQLFSKALEKSWEAVRVRTYFLEKEEMSYSCTEAVSGEISVANPLVEYMALRRGRPFVLETIENDRESISSLASRKFYENCVKAMRSLGADVIIPFLQETKLVGFSAVTMKEGVTISNDQLRLLIPVSRQMGFLLKNAQAFRVLRDRDRLAAVGELAAGMAHEIKNPLGAIQGAAELIKGTALEQDPSASEFVEIILDESRRLSKVLSDFLDYAKPRRDDPKAVCCPLKVVEHTAAMVLRDEKVAFEISCERENLIAEVDPEILKQVLLNLFLNAIQAMSGHSTEKPSLKVTLREIPKRLLPFAESLSLAKVWEGWQRLEDPRGQSFLEIEVADNGPGIPEEDLGRIFMPFFTTKQKGTGLGLAICQRLIEGMGGTISVKTARRTREYGFGKNHMSDFGSDAIGISGSGGAVFTIHIPMKRTSSILANGRERRNLSFGNEEFLESHF